jgi:hypothetical protein
MTPEVFVAAQAAVSTDTKSAFAGLVQRGFKLVQTTGFYPRMLAHQAAAISAGARREIGIDFWMSLAEGGGYRSEWTRDAPFDLGGYKTITCMERGELIRYWKPHSLYVARPYEVSIRTLGADLLLVAATLETWSDEVVLTTGKRVKVPPPAEP